MRRLEIVIDDRFKGKITNSLVSDLYEEVFFTNPVVLRGVRGAIIRKSVSGLPMIIRLYRRGGLAKYFLNSVFIRSPFAKLKNSRPIREFWILKLLSGLSVPTPIAVALDVGLITYSGIIITKEIPISQTLLESPPQDLDFAVKCAYKAGKITKQIIDKGVFHRDLHVGNVLYQGDGSVYIIDFDGAKTIKTEKEKQQAKEYISKRWIRSTRKWFRTSPALEKALGEPFLRGLNE